MTAWPTSLRIDVRAVMNAVPLPPRPHLVTRPTGRAVRAAIEDRLPANGAAPCVSLVDFAGVTVLDFSCADEVVAKLLLRHIDGDRPRNAFFLFRVIASNHRHAFEEVLLRHRLAAACDLGDGCYRLLGAVTSDEERVWDALESRRVVARGGLDDLADCCARGTLGDLVTRRLGYVGPQGATIALSAIAARDDLDRLLPV